MNEGRPHAYVEGELGDGCTSLEQVTQERIRNAVTITFTSVKQGNGCAEPVHVLNALVVLDGPFAPGEYSVKANDATARFRLVATAAGELRLDPDPGPPPQFPGGPPIPGAMSPDDLSPLPAVAPVTNPAELSELTRDAGTYGRIS